MNFVTNWNPDRYGKDGRFVADLGAPLVALLAPGPGERILDLGCGDGVLTEKIAASGCTVIAVDASRAQVTAARQRGLPAVVMDGHHPCFPPCFDAVFTNAALHWMKDPERVARGVWSVLKPGGRFVGEFGGQGNIARIHAALYTALRRRAIDPAAVDPWYYPSDEEYRRVLANAGFIINHIALIPRPTKLPGDIRDWLELFAQPFLHSVREAERRDLCAELARALEAELRDPGGHWVADYVRLRFAATKPGR